MIPPPWQQLGTLMVLQQLLLLLSGDVEQNPGPIRNRPEAKPDKNKIMQDKVEAHEAKMAELEEVIKSQKELIEELRTTQVELKKKMEEKEVESAKALDELKVELEARREENKVLTSSVDELAAAKQEQQQRSDQLESEIRRLQARLSGVDDLGSQSEDTTLRVRDLEVEVDEILEKLWELDKSWRNNLVFYGLRGEDRNEEDQRLTEQKIRDIISKNMQISRDIPILRVKRSWNGPEVRGSKPVTVYFEKWQDKDEVKQIDGHDISGYHRTLLQILRKSKMLKGSNIFVSEEFSKRVRDHRAELQKFMKAMRKRRPTAKFNLQYDKLYVDKEVFVFNEVTGKVEMANDTSITLNEINQELHGPNSAALIRKKSSGRRRLQKSYSNESSLHQLPDSTNTYRPESPEKSSSSSRYLQPPESPTKSPAKRYPADQNGRRHEDEETESEDDGIVDYNDGSGPMSPVKRLSAVIPETIPE